MTDQIQATYTDPYDSYPQVYDLQNAINSFLSSGGSSSLNNPFPVCTYVTWTANNYWHTHLVATAVYNTIDTTPGEWAADRQSLSLFPNGTDGNLAWVANPTDPASIFWGTAGTNSTLTTYGYESTYLGGGSPWDVPNYMGRQDKTVAPDGTITEVFYDARGNVLQTWVGTHDVPNTDYNDNGDTNSEDFRYWVSQNPTAVTGPAGTNMVLVSSSTYDADGNLISTTSYANATDHYTTCYQYDSYDRQIGTVGPDGVATMYTLDNLGNVTEIDTYAHAAYNASTKQITDYNDRNDPNAPPVTATSNAEHLREKTVNKYDALGRVYESDVYNVNPATGNTEITSGLQDGHYLPTYTWYDQDGNVIKTETGTTGAFTKYAYDALGRLTMQYIGYNTSVVPEMSGTWDEADTVGSNDTILEQDQTWYDAAGDAVAAATYKQFASDTPVTGRLTAANSYTTASAIWYDALGRQAATANYGREDTAAGYETRSVFNGTNGDVICSNPDHVPDVADANPPLPYSYNVSNSSGDAYIVSLTKYDAAGLPYQTIDNLGRTNETLYDAAGRVVLTIQNYVPGGFYNLPAAGNSDTAVHNDLKQGDTEQDVTVKYDYDSAGRLATMVAFNADGSTVTAQATKYLYDSTVNASWQTGVVYPDDTADIPTQDPATRDWSITNNGGDHTETTYDRLGRTLTATDQRGVVHTYGYDLAGRLSADEVTSLGTSEIVDYSVLAIVTIYDDLGRVETVTSYDSANPDDFVSGHIVNQVEDQYDGWGNLDQEWQSHALHAAVDTNTTPSVQYTYVDDAVAGVAQYVRLTDISYPNDPNGPTTPNGQNVHYNYNTGTQAAVDQIMSRLSSISDSESSAD